MKENQNMNHRMESDTDDSGFDPDLQTRLIAMIDRENEDVVPAILTERIIRAVRHQRSSVWRFEDLWSGIRIAWFRPAFVLGVALVLLLAFFNARQAHFEESERSATEVVLGLHPVTLAAAYDDEIASISR